MIYFNSDYLEGAHPALMAKLNETNILLFLFLILRYQ